MVPIRYRQRVRHVKAGAFFHYWGFVNGNEPGAAFTSPENFTHPSEQSLGHTDKDGNELFVGDILELTGPLFNSRIGEIYQTMGGGFACCGFSICDKQESIKKIGDKHQNLELLK
jgi:hypothetical protein